MSDPFLGEIRLFCGNFAPTGWALCNGQLMAISQNTALFSLLGTQFGGNGTSNFGLPNFQGNVPVDQGQGIGLSPRVMGETAGTATVTLLTTNLPSHSHQLFATSTVATSATPSTTLMFGATPSDFRSYANPTSNDQRVEVDFATQAIDTAGSSLPHDNLMPYLAMSYIIALQGIFPSRN